MKKTVNVAIVWILAAVIAIEAAAIAVLIATRVKTTDNPSTPGGIYGQNDLCNHFRVQEADYENPIVAYFLVTDENGSPKIYSSLEEMTAAFGNQISAGTKSPQEVSGKTLESKEYRYCPQCGSTYEYGTLKLITNAIKYDVVVNKELFISEEYEKIWTLQGDGGVIQYLFRVWKQTIIQFCTDWGYLLLDETEVVEVDALEYQIEETALYTSEEYQKVLDEKNKLK